MTGDVYYLRKKRHVILSDPTIRVNSIIHGSTEHQFTELNDNQRVIQQSYSNQKANPYHLVVKQVIVDDISDDD